MHGTIARRKVLTSLGAAAAGVALLRDAVADQHNPAANVADRTSTLKITSARGLPCGSKCYVKIETNHGITGWGEITSLEPTIAAALVASLFELLKDENPTRIEFLWQKIYRSHRDLRGGAFMTHALSGIDMALWDITGRCWNVPVYRLLGATARDKIRMYPSKKAKKTGTAGPHPHSGDPPDIQGLVKLVKDARKEVGPDGCVMFDAHSAVPPAALIQFAAAIEPFDMTLLEEPAVPGNIEVFKRLKQQIRIPLATGERDRTIWGVLPYLQERCIDILQPDCGHTGGITQVRKIATLAEAYFVPLAPHCTMSHLGLTASLHVATSVPYLLIHEGYPDAHIMPAGVAIKHWTLGEDGYATLPEGVGLGVEIDESKFAEVNADPKRKFKWPKPTSEDGSVRDY